MALMTETMNISGTGFYPNGNVTVMITPYTGSTAGAVYTQTGTASATGTIAISIPISSIPGAGTATTFQMYVTDIYTGAVSNTVTIPLTQITVNPQLVGPTGGITFVNVI
jgi:uncharacterized membrane protein